MKDLPDFLDYRMDNRTYRFFKGEALFPFGHGLSYTTFDLSKPTYKNGKVTLTVKNTGKAKGSETVQIYIKRVGDTSLVKTLRGYKRVSLLPGESRQVVIPLPRERFEYWDEGSNTMRVIPGKYELMVGNSSAASQLSTIVVKVK